MQAVCLLTEVTRRTRCCCRSSAGTSGAPRGPWRGSPWRWHTRSWQAMPPRSSGACLNLQQPCPPAACPHLCHAHGTECFDRRLPFSTPARKGRAGWLMQRPRVSLLEASRQWAPGRCRRLRGLAAPSGAFRTGGGRLSSCAAPARTLIERVQSHKHAPLRHPAAAMLYAPIQTSVT